MPSARQIRRNAQRKPTPKETPMRAQLEAKRQEALQQIPLWQQQVAACQEQINRWAGILDLCNELLEEGADVHSPVLEDAEPAT